VFGIVHDASQAGNLVGQSELEMAFTDLQINGMLFPIQSQGVKAVGEKSGRDTAKKVAAGALIGGAFGGGSGAAKGAAIGGGAALLTRGKSVKVAAGTMLELTLLAAAKVPAPADAAVAAAPAAVAPAPAAAPAAPVAAAAPGAAAAPAAAAAAPPDDAQKACVKKLMANGFSADEALHSCNKPK
jgi:predicted lipid-binding transport protein (Tim44 family)